MGEHWVQFGQQAEKEMYYSRRCTCKLCKFIALIALLLDLEEGFFWAVAFVETSVLMLYVVHNIRLKILGMFIYLYCN